MGSLSLLQGIFLTQELNWGLLPCRQILYQLSYQKSPVAVLRLLIVMAFLVEYDLKGMQASVSVAHGLNSCGSQVLEHRLNSCGSWA